MRITLRMDASGLSCHGNNICSREYPIPNAYILEYSIAPIFFSFFPCSARLLPSGFSYVKKYPLKKKNKKVQRWRKSKKITNLKKQCGLEQVG